MISGIKISNLSDIGANLAPNSLFAVVDMNGTPFTNKANLQIIANAILSGAGGSYFVPAAQANLALSVANAAQPNITSVGTLTSLVVSGNITVADLESSGNIVANFFVGDGRYLTNLPDVYSNANVAGYLPTYTGNISGDYIVLNHDVTSNVVYANFLYGDGSNITNLPVGNIASLNLDGNSGNVLYGNGVFAAINTGANIGNLEITGANLYIANSASEQELNVSASDNGWALLQLPVDATANAENVRLVNSAGNVTIEAGDLSVGSNQYSWLFDNTANLTTPSNLHIGPIGVVSGTAITQADEVLVVASSGNAAQLNIGWAENISAPGNVALINFNNNLGNINLVTGDSNATTYSWDFDNEGNVYVPGSIIGKTPNNNGSLQWVGNSSGDNLGYTTLNIVPDNSLIVNDQYLIIDPTAPSHIHIRAGGIQDSSSSVLFLGGERNHVSIQDNVGVVVQNLNVSTTGYLYNFPSDFSAGSWFEDTGSYYIQYTSTNPNLDTKAFEPIANIIVSYLPGPFSTLTYAGSSFDLGGGTYKVQVNEAPPTNPTAITAIEYYITVSNTNYIQLQNNDIVVDATSSIDVNAGNTVTIRSYSTTDPINIVTSYNTLDKTWVFASDGTFTAPGNVYLEGDVITVGPGADTLAASLANPTLVVSSNSDTYVQAALNNVSDIGSADWIAYGHHGNDAGGWADLGFTSAAFGDANYTITGAGDGYVFVQGFLPGQAPFIGGGNLVLATGDNGLTRDIVFATGGFHTEDEFGRISHSNNALELTRANSSVVATIVKTTPVTVETLPLASAVGAGARAFVTDADSTSFGNLVVGGGIYYMPVFSNGVDWYIG